VAAREKAFLAFKERSLTFYDCDINVTCMRTLREKTFDFYKSR